MQRAGTAYAKAWWSSPVAEIKYVADGYRKLASGDFKGAAAHAANGVLKNSGAVQAAGLVKRVSEIPQDAKAVATARTPEQVGENAQKLAATLFDTTMVAGVVRATMKSGGAAPRGSSRETPSESGSQVVVPDSAPRAESAPATKASVPTAAPAPQCFEEIANTYAPSADAASFGPYIHGINKGNLSSIVQEQQLIATNASEVAGGQPAVRAYTHSLDKLGPNPSTDFVEFNTGKGPTGANPGQSSVSWAIDEGARLDVTITRIAHTDGSVTIFPQK